MGVGMTEREATVLERAAEFITQRKMAALSGEITEGEHAMGHVDIERHLGLVASTWDVDASETNRLAGEVALQFLIYGWGVRMNPETIVRSAWLDGFCLGLAHAHIAEQDERRDDDAQAA